LEIGAETDEPFAEILATIKRVDRAGTIFDEPHLTRIMSIGLRQWAHGF